jgi:hypothetical protein
VNLHALKTWPEQWEAVASGLKTFEIRYDDRGFAVGDYLRLAEWDPRTDRFTGRQTLRRVTFLMRGPAFGLHAGYVAMSIVGIEEET